MVCQDFMEDMLVFLHMKVQDMLKTKLMLSRKESKFKKHMPDIYLVKSEKLIVYDNFNNSIQVIYNANPQETSYEDVQIE